MLTTACCFSSCTRPPSTAGSYLEDAGIHPVPLASHLDDRIMDLFLIHGRLKATLLEGNGIVAVESPIVFRMSPLARTVTFRIYFSFSPNVLTVGMVSTGIHEHHYEYP